MALGYMLVGSQGRFRAQGTHVLKIPAGFRTKAIFTEDNLLKKGLNEREVMAVRCAESLISNKAECLTPSKSAFSQII